MTSRAPRIGTRFTPPRTRPLSVLYLYIYTYTYIHIYTYIYIYIHTQIHTHIHTYTHIHTHIYTSIHIYVYIHLYIYTVCPLRSLVVHAFSGRSGLPRAVQCVCHAARACALWRAADAAAARATAPRARACDGARIRSPIAGCLPAGCCCMLRASCCSLHVMSRRLFVACCVLYVACCMLTVAISMLHAACCVLDVVCCMLLVAILSPACCMLHVVWCMLYVACGLPHVTCRMLRGVYVASSTLRCACVAPRRRGNCAWLSACLQRDRRGHAPCVVPPHTCPTRDLRSAAANFWRGYERPRHAGAVSVQMWAG